jgi:hypothetical protein
MRYAEIMIETPQDERSMRNAARKLVKEIVFKDHDFLDHAVVKNVNKSGTERFYPVAYTATSYPNLVVGIMADLSNAALIQLSRNETTFANGVSYLIAFGIRREYRYPDEPSFESMMDIAKRYMPNYHFLKASVTNPPTTFIHEFAHYWDYSHAGVDISPTNAGKDLETYFNNPLERNAYFQEMMAQIDKNPKWFKLPFTQFQQKVFKLLDKDFLRNLKQDGRQRLISRLYSAWSAKQ